ncbi:hypothetical protein FB45DRAFT_874274 [Roridomyces roridus]|uniref:Uncharacterized protein n=1 Tax=Roridomyces roridus TaxID=1738132 RepID=A0AAD7FEK4_9AGAR|nr:hypothetical protein FB45DRAFT_874274 [Roridomyces roridus]
MPTDVYPDEYEEKDKVKTSDHRVEVDTLEKPDKVMNGYVSPLEEGRVREGWNEVKGRKSGRGPEDQSSVKIDPDCWTYIGRVGNVLEVDRETIRDRHRTVPYTVYGRTVMVKYGTICTVPILYWGSREGSTGTAVPYSAR